MIVLEYFNTFYILYVPYMLCCFSRYHQVQLLLQAPLYHILLGKDQTTK